MMDPDGVDGMCTAEPPLPAGNTCCGVEGTRMRASLGVDGTRLAAAAAALIGTLPARKASRGVEGMTLPHPLPINASRGVDGTRWAALPKGVDGIVFRTAAGVAGATNASLGVAGTLLGPAALTTAYPGVPGIASAGVPGAGRNIPGVPGGAPAGVPANRNNPGVPGGGPAGVPASLNSGPGVPGGGPAGVPGMNRCIPGVAMPENVGVTGKNPSGPICLLVSGAYPE